MIRGSLFALAAGTAAYLAWVSLSGGSVAGCGLDSPCERVLRSRWAYWFNLPVALPAAAIYATLSALAFQRAASTGLTKPVTLALAWCLALLVLAAALWFGLLQAAVLRSFCAFCLGAHATAALAAILELADLMHPGPDGRRSSRPAWLAPSFATLIVFGVLVSGQFVVTRPSHAVLPLTSQTGARTGDAPAFREGNPTADPNAIPRIGSAPGRPVLTVLFDYTCAHCRELHEMLRRRQQRPETAVSIQMLPVPLDRTCNRLVERTAPENANACDYARLALAVWRAQPDSFAAFSDMLFAPPRPPPLALAREHAERLVGDAAVEAALADPWVRDQLQANVNRFETNSRRAGIWQLPQVMLGNAVSVGAIADEEALDSLIRDHSPSPRPH